MKMTRKMVTWRHTSLYWSGYAWERVDVVSNLDPVSCPKESHNAIRHKIALVSGATMTNTVEVSPTRDTDCQVIFTTLNALRIQFPTTTRNMKYNIGNIAPASPIPPHERIPSYMTAFQSSPVRIWGEKNYQNITITKSYETGTHPSVRIKDVKHISLV